MTEQDYDVALDELDILAASIELYEDVRFPMDQVING